MESNRIEGIGHQVKGAVMEGLGKAIGDAKLRPMEPPSAQSATNRTLPALAGIN